MVAVHEPGNEDPCVPVPMSSLHATHGTVVPPGVRVRRRRAGPRVVAGAASASSGPPAPATRRRGRSGGRRRSCRGRSSAPRCRYRPPQWKPPSPPPATAFAAKTCSFPRKPKPLGVLLVPDDPRRCRPSGESEVRLDPVARRVDVQGRVAGRRRGRCPGAQAPGAGLLPAERAHARPAAGRVGVEQSVCLMPREAKIWFLAASSLAPPSRPDLRLARHQADRLLDQRARRRDERERVLQAADPAPGA